MPVNSGKTSFGELLRQYREKSVDRYSQRPLSQGRLAEMLLHKRGLIFGRNNIGKWESGRKIIPADDRKTLIALLAILVNCGGITTIEEADRLLEAGYYSKLGELERVSVNPVWKSTISPTKVMRGNEAVPEDIDRPDSVDPVSEKQKLHSIIPPNIEISILKFWSELETIFTSAKDGPPPAWPRVLVSLSRLVMDRWTTPLVLKALLWLWLWLLTWLSIGSSLRWPFAAQEGAVLAIVLYSAGTLLIPPFIVVLIQPKGNKFWQEQKLATNKIFYLYVYQGAGIGFHLGYFVLFLIALLGYHFHLQSTLWLELTGALLPLGLGYIAAQLVPFNLWRAYGRLNLTDGGVFFIFLILGPIWAYFFLTFYSTFLTPIVGITVMLLAATCMTALMVRQQRKTGINIIPAHIWVLIYGTMLVLYEISLGQNWQSAISLISLLTILSLLLSLERIQFTLPGMITVVFALGLLLIFFNFNLILGRILTVLLIFSWWVWGRKLLSLPLSFWIVVLAIAISTWALNAQYLSLGWSNTIVVLTTLIVVLWEWNRKPKE